MPVPRRQARLQVESLEARDTPSAVAEAGPNNTFAQYQPLNNDTTYTVSGRIDSLADIDYYAIYVKAGTGIRVQAGAAIPTGNIHTEFDPTVGLFAPDGTLVAAADGGGTASLGAARLTLTSTQSGVWRVAVSHHGDLTFDGTAPVRPSGNPTNPNNTGPGLHTGTYSLAVVGGLKPQITVADPVSQKVFYIDGNSPQMPSLTAELIGVAPAPDGSTRYSWHTIVGYRATDYPAIEGQRGPGRTIVSPVYDTHVITGSTDFTPDFSVGDSQVIRGGRLLLTAQVRIGGTTLTAATPNVGPARLQILGQNPDRDEFKAYVDSIPVPALWPADSPYSFQSIVRKMMAQESSVAQFDASGVPFWSEDGRFGAGVLQLTDPVPTPQQVWDWCRNIDGAVALLTEDLELANDRLGVLFDRVRSQVPMGVIAAPITGDMIVQEALRAYNALDNGIGDRDEFRASRDSGGKLRIVQLPSGERSTIWEHLPIGLRGTGIGDPNYVTNVLSQVDY